MAKVRALGPCQWDLKYRNPGDVFDYEGPEQPFLQLLEGEWAKAQRPAEKIRSNEDLADENKRLQAELAKLRGQQQPKARVQKPAAVADVDDAAPADEPEATEAPPPPKKRKARSKNAGDSAVGV